MGRIVGLSLIVYCFLGPHAQGQARVLAPDGLRLKPGVDSLAVYLIKGTDTTRTGTITDELRRTGGQPGARLVRVYQSLDAVLGNRLDTIIDELPGLRPRAHYSVSSQLLHRLDFDSTSVSGWVRLANGDSADVHVPLPVGAFNGASFDLLIRAADLELGQRFSVPSFLPSTRTVVPVGARVDRTQNLAGQPCWVVVADFGGMAVTFWIDQQSRRLRQQLMQFSIDTAVLFRDPTESRAPKRAT